MSARMPVVDVECRPASDPSPSPPSSTSSPVIVAGKSSPSERQISRKMGEHMADTQNFRCTLLLHKQEEEEDPKKFKWKQAFTFALTFFAYVSYYISRKPLSVAKSEIIDCFQKGNRTDDNGERICSSFITEIDGKPESEAKRVSSLLDSTFLFSYAFFLFVCGVIAERSDLRCFLTLGMVLTGASAILFGAGKFMGIHSIAFYLFAQFVGGGVQATGWPAVICVMTNWFGKSKRGLVFGFWNANVSVGNILGSILAGAMVEHDWGLSFAVPGMVTISFGVLVWAFVMPSPAKKPLICTCNGSNLPDERATELNLEAETCLPLTVDEKEEEEEEKAISFLGALKIPGVIEFSFCLFFVKLVCITFHFWLPYFIKETGLFISPAAAAYLSTVFDLGGIVGGICAGQISDYTGKSGLTCAIMLFAAIPSLFVYQLTGRNCPLDWTAYDECYLSNVFSLFVLGILVNGPYALISTAVSVNLGTHESLKGSSRALATVTTIIDGTGGAGAAVGPFLAGAIPGGVQNVFYMLMTADLLALLLLARPIKSEMSKYFS